MSEYNSGRCSFTLFCFVSGGLFLPLAGVAGVCYGLDGVWAQVHNTAFMHETWAV